MNIDGQDAQDGGGGGALEGEVEVGYTTYTTGGSPAVGGRYRRAFALHPELNRRFVIADELDLYPDFEAANADNLSRNPKVRYASFAHPCV